MPGISSRFAEYSIPSMPGVSSHFAEFSIPSMPGVSSRFAEFSIPSMPEVSSHFAEFSIPSMPGVSSRFAEFSIPSMPGVSSHFAEFSIPSMPGVSSRFAEFSIPSMPGVSSRFAEFSIPSMPGVSSRFAEFSIPSMPGVSSRFAEFSIPVRSVFVKDVLRAPTPSIHERHMHCKSENSPLYPFGYFNQPTELFTFEKIVFSLFETVEIEDCSTATLHTGWICHPGRYNWLHVKPALNVSALDFHIQLYCNVRCKKPESKIYTHVYDVLPHDPVGLQLCVTNVGDNPIVLLKDIKLLEVSWFNCTISCVRAMSDSEGSVRSASSVSPVLIEGCPETQPLLDKPPASVCRKRKNPTKKSVCKKLKFCDSVHGYILKVFHVCSSLAACHNLTPLAFLRFLAEKLPQCKNVDLRIDVARILRVVQLELSRCLEIDPDWNQFLSVAGVTSWAMLSPTLPVMKVIEWVDSWLPDSPADPMEYPSSIDIWDGDVDARCSRDWLSVGDPSTTSTSSDSGQVATSKMSSVILSKQDGNRPEEGLVEACPKGSGLGCGSLPERHLRRGCGDVPLQSKYEVDPGQGSLDCQGLVLLESVLKGRLSVEMLVKDYYMTIEETKDWVWLLLRIQFNDNEEDVSHFLVTLYHVVTAQNDKKNVLEIVSDPSACKSTFITMVGDAMLNTSYCNCVNRYERFCFQNIANVRLAIFDDGAKGTLLCLFSSDKVNLARKNQSDYVQLNTPFVVLSNKSHFNGVKWNARIERFRLRTWSEIKGQRKFNPNFTYDLFEYVQKELMV
ncbi:hypothetical protein PR048_010715 [Dryococelus australis]|uniref:Uncharacterized protein n=1 Tax=Dryococelus australis TaxID=614101 RepID=A0ABQ9I3H3_9NEOP|nr:hypothetical protein PR048_010715 [Dryococelus australis]